MLDQQAVDLDGVSTPHGHLGGVRSGADPFVIGFAKARSGTVVTEEHPTGRLDKPHIPDVCDALGIPCLNLVQFVTEQGWHF
ncbi:DUF4411 family protein [Glycomyces sp. NPDC047369]